jgi:predicted nuclease of predicted toxin-antitoxin system
MTQPAAKSKSWKRPGSKRAFYLDENVPAFVGRQLQALGYNVGFVAQVKPGGTDVAQLIHATKEDRIFVTLDRDFRSSMFPEFRIQQAPGVFVLATDAFDQKTFTRLVGFVVKAASGRSMKGRICRVSTDGVRFLPRKQLLPS